MNEDHWVTAALTNDAVVAELLIRLKQQQSSSSQPPLLPSVTWAHRKSRSRPHPSTTTAATTATDAVVNGDMRKEQQQSGSPTTPLCWTSEDGYDESNRPSDLSSGGCRSTKGGLGNEGATTSSYKKSRKRKSFAELKEEEDFLLKEQLHLNKIDLHQNSRKETDKMPETVNHRVQTSSVKVPKIETKALETGFVLPDLNMAPDDEES
ncbi:uncharacterized protein [Rutidosis leptorrhynchoides]|uniref:uncharacterized protein n=1 Tax=Rutidosis leptorrhynchoides TaxID=125765 RepID=UPI003A9934AE